MISTLKRNDALRFLGMLEDKVFIGPEKLVIHITDRCNFRCSYCYYHAPCRKRKNPKNDIDFDFFKKIIDECHDLGIEIVSLSGSGEPVLHPKIWDMIDYIKSKGMILSLITNGSFDKKFLKHILKVDFLVVSLSSVSEERFRELQCGSKGMFRKIINNLFYLSKMKTNRDISKPFIQLNFVLSEKNYKDIEKIFELSDKLRIEKINFRIMVPTRWNDKIAFSRKGAMELKRIISKSKNQDCFSRIGNNLDNVYKILSDPAFQETGHPYRNSTNLFRPPGCYSGWYYMSMDIDGNVIPCCQIPELIIGNVYKKPLKEIWNSEKFQKLRLNGKHKMHGNKFIACNFCYLRNTNKKIYEKINRLKPPINNYKKNLIKI